MSFRSAIARSAKPLQPDYVRRDPTGGNARAVFRFSVPVLRVRDVSATIAWYRRHLGFGAETFPEHGTPEFAILERDGVQLLVRGTSRPSRTTHDARSGTPRPERSEGTHDERGGWDLYLWADGVDLARLEASIGIDGGDVVRSLSPMGASMAELEIRDPDGYVLCIGGPTQPALAQT